MAMTLWDAIRAEATICQFTPELIHQDFFDFCENQMLVTEMEIAIFFEVRFGKKTKESN